jgi:hypothetical protein
MADAVASGMWYYPVITDKRRMHSSPSVPGRVDGREGLLL